MAIPPTVIGGEIITDEWGNSVRDWATVGIGMGGTQESVSDSGITTTYETGASVVFTKPVSWVTYQIMAWGSAAFFSLASSIGKARIVIGASNGTEEVHVSLVASAPHTVSAQHSATGLTGATTTVSIQYGETSGTVQKESTLVNYIAIRTT